MQNTWLQVAYLCTGGFNLEILPRGFVMQRQILINVIIFVAYMLNLPLNTQRPYHRSQRTGKLGLDFGSWQSPDISRSHLYRSTIAWTPPTTIYREYTVVFCEPDMCCLFQTWLSVRAPSWSPTATHTWRWVRATRKTTAPTWTCHQKHHSVWDYNDTLMLNEISANKALLNSLAPGRSEFDSENVIFNLVLLIGIFRSYHDNALRWMSQDLTDDKSTLVQVMAWCRQATSHYLSQCWLSSLSPYGVARPQWVNSLWPTDTIWRQRSVNIGSGNSLLPDGTKPLPEPMLTGHPWSSVTFTEGQFHKQCLDHQSLKSVWKLHV